MKTDLEVRNKVIAVFNTELQRIFRAHPDVMSVHIAVDVDPRGGSYAALKEINLVTEEGADDETESLITQIDSEISSIHNPAISEYYNGVTFTREALFSPQQPLTTKHCTWFVTETASPFIQ